MSQFSVLNVGFGNIVLVSKIVSIIHSDSASAKRIRNEAKSNNSLIDATQGKKTRYDYSDGQQSSYSFQSKS